METLVQYFTNHIGTDKIWTAFLLLAIYYILKKEPFKVFAHFSDKKDKEHELAKELLQSEKLGKEANDFLREHLEKTAFRRYYGIYADPEMRSALIKFYKKHQRELGWHDLRRAYPNIKLVGTKVTAQLQWFEHLLRWMVTGMCYLIGAYALFVMVYAIVVGSSNKAQFFALTLAALVLLLATMFFSSLNWAYHSTRRVIAAADKDSQ
jgi:hypothetical protein